MKKVLLLIIIPFFLSGCFDYNELTDLAIITGVAIDYDNEYEVTFEIVSTKKSGDTAASTSSYTVSSKGKTIAEAIRNNGNNIDKVAYFDHVELVLVSEDIAKNHFEEVTEYIVRSAKFRNEVIVAIAKDSLAKNIISKSTKEHPLISTFLVNMLENSNDASSAGYYAPFTETLGDILTDGEDAKLSAFSIDNADIKLNGMGIFKNFKLQRIINNDEASTVNLLSNFKSKNTYFTKICDKDKKTIISIYESNIKFEPTNKKINIKGKLNGRIILNECNYNLKESSTYQTLENEFKSIIEDKIDNVINIMKTENSNVLKIGKAYYNKYYDKDFYLWTKLPINYDIDFKINKKGLIFELESDDLYGHKF